MEKHSLKRVYRLKKKELVHTYKEDVRRAKKEYVSELTELLAKEGRLPINPPKRALLEEIGNAVSHGVGAVFAMVALVLMCIAADTVMEYVGAFVYFFGEMTMFSISCLYHALRNGGAAKRVFRRFDYSSIYLMIGGTFAPILLCYSESGLAPWFFAIQWLLIVTGITFIGVFGPTRLKWLHMPMYLLLGWCGIMFIPEMLARGDYLFFGLILGGGVVYSVGVIPFVLKRRAAHFIWHFFVLGGAVVQWIGIYSVIYLG